MLSLFWIILSEVAQDAEDLSKFAQQLEHHGLQRLTSVRVAYLTVGNDEIQTLFDFSEESCPDCSQVGR
jgi:hypothetical protein